MGRGAGLRLRLAAALLAVPLAASGHHGWSEYDASKLLKLSGKIVESDYERPHGHLRLETVGEGAKAGKTWLVVLASPLRMDVRGLTPEMLMPGGSVSVEGYADREHPEEMRAERIMIQGRSIELR